MERSYRYLGYFLLLLLPLIAVAFHETYGSKFPTFEPGYDPFIHVHAALATCWVALLIVQPFLIANKKLGWHRTLGKASYVIFPLFILSFVPAWIKIIDSGVYLNLFLSAGDCLLLIIFYSLSIYYRTSSAKHMRFMIAAAIVLLGPTIGRIGPIMYNLNGVITQTIQYAIIFLILTTLIFYDMLNKKDFRPYSIGIMAFIIHAVFFYILFL